MSLGRAFGVLWTANASSNLADGIAFVTMPLLAASMTDDPRLVAGLATIYAIVRLAVVVPIGVWIDRVDRRTLMVSANLLRGGALLALALTIQLGAASLLVLYVVMAVVGTLESLADDAAVALLPTLVRGRRLDGANARISAAQLVADEFVGPPLGGFLFAIAVAVPVYAMGGLWAAAGLIALALPTHRSIAGSATAEARERRPLHREAGEGIVWLARHPVVGCLALVGALASVGYMLAFSILVLFAHRSLGLDSTGYGVLLAVSALGGLVGTFLAPRLRNAIGARWTIVLSLALGAGTLAGLAIARDPIIAAVLLALYILHAVVWGICSASLRQRLVPDGLRGRVGGASKMLSLAGLAVGSALGGLLGAVDLTIPIAAGGAVLLVCCVIALVALPRRRLEWDSDGVE